MNTHATFFHCSDTVIDFIRSAHKSLEIAVCWLTHPAIFEALRMALERGVRLSLYLNYDQINFNPQGLPFATLHRAGATISGYCGPGLLHYKLAIADGEKVLSGSFNWTRSEHADMVVVTHDPALAQQCSDALRALMIASVPYEQLRKVPPRKIDFRQLYTPVLSSWHEFRRRLVSGAGAWISCTTHPQQYHQWEREQTHSLTLKTQLQWPFLPGEWEEKSFRNWLTEAPCTTAMHYLLRRYCLRLRCGDIIFAVEPDGVISAAGIVGGEPEYSLETNSLSRFTQWIPLVKGKTILMPAKQSNKTFFPYKGAALALLDGG